MKPRSLKAKAKRPTTENKTKCKKQRKSNSCLRACLREGEGPQVGEVTRLGGVKKITLLYMQSYAVIEKSEKQKVK